MPSRRLGLLVSLSCVMVLAACGSFGSAPSPVEAPDSGLDGSAPVPDAAPADAGADVSVPPGPECDVPLVTDPNVAMECPGSPGKVYPAIDARNCGRCGYSCGSESCVDGLCEERKEASQIERMLGSGDAAVLVSTSAQILAYSATMPPAIVADTKTETPMRAVYSGSGVYWRSGDRLRNARGLDLPVGGMPFLAPSPASVVSSSTEKIVEVDVGTNQPVVFAQVPSPREIVRVGDDYVVHSAVTATGAKPSLRLLPGTKQSPTELVADVGALTGLQAFGDAAYYSTGDRVFRIAKTGGTPVEVAKSPKPIKAYFGGPPLAVDATTVRFLATQDETNFELYEQERCPGAKPRLVATPQNSKGVLVTNDRVYWIVASDQLYSRAIAKKR